MHKPIIIAGITLLLVSATSTFNLERERYRSEDIAHAFSMNLKNKLARAIMDKGVIGALGICKTEAQRLADEYGHKEGVTLRRVSLKVRNPKNKPDAYEEKILHSFEKRLKNKEAIFVLESAEVVEENGKRTYRFMKAIPIRGLCLNCHGTRVKPKVKARIKELYPDDQATGYGVGQLRGAISITKTLPETP